MNALTFPHFRRCRTALLGLALGAALVATRAAAAPALDNGAPDPAALIRSEFNNDPALGWDPFFPKSSRRPKPVVTNAVAVLPPQPIFPEQLQLKGIAISGGSKFAILNGYTFAEGEELDMKLSGQIFRVFCHEIKERSVILSVKGVKKELQLRTGF